MDLQPESLMYVLKIKVVSRQGGHFENEYTPTSFCLQVPIFVLPLPSLFLSSHFSCAKPAHHFGCGSFLRILNRAVNVYDGFMGAFLKLHGNLVAIKLDYKQICLALGNRFVFDHQSAVINPATSDTCR